MTRRRVVGVVLLVAGAALVIANRPSAPPPGFASIRSAPWFQDAGVLAEAWQLPVAHTYPQPVLSQTNPSACGPTSVANVLRSLGQDATADDVAAHGAGCFGGVCFGGLTLEEFATAARASAPKLLVTTLHPDSVEALRTELRHSNDLGVRYVMNFHRGPLFGAGGGHHSPIGGYVEALDAVFVLDVNSHFGPWLVSTPRLFEAMNTTDGSAGKRGLIKFAQREQ